MKVNYKLIKFISTKMLASNLFLESVVCQSNIWPFFIWVLIVAKGNSAPWMNLNFNWQKLIIIYNIIAWYHINIINKFKVINYKDWIPASGFNTRKKCMYISIASWINNNNKQDNEKKSETDFYKDTLSHY